MSLASLTPAPPVGVSSGEPAPAPAAHRNHTLTLIKRRTIMRGAVLHASGDVRVEEREDPRLVAPTDAIIRLSATCVCGSDLWPYRGIEKIDGPAPMGHEYVGVVEEVGSDVRNVRPGQF